MTLSKQDILLESALVMCQDIVVLLQFGRLFTAKQPDTQMVLCLNTSNISWSSPIVDSCC
jgi:hypothetical protein